SGPEDQVQITLPLESGSLVTQLQFKWNCQTLPNLRRLGPAAQFYLLARNLSTGQFENIAFVSSGRSATGVETITFGSLQTPITVATDRLEILLTAREAGVDSYSIKEVSLQNGSSPVPVRLPGALSNFPFGSYSI